MHQKEIRFTYSIHSDKDSLSVNDQQLVEQAKQATTMAYAPYSKFKVGVAIRTQDGEITIGSNQENGAYPIGQCAERVALYRLTHEHGRKPIDTIAIVVDNENQKTPASPCGSCRQILNEYRSFQLQPIRLLLAIAEGGEILDIHDVKDLLPFAFDGSFLGQ
ncbi:MAG TPA: cytidine deaminase [Saprospiraceae bacterium]|nr:cytidine deaminase [Saprospiraceae bacterium]